MRSGIGENKATMMKLSKANYLKTGGLIDAVQIYLWALSANNEGDIKKANVVLTPEESPYFEVDSGNCRIEVHEFSQALKGYMKGAIEGAKNGPEMLKEGADLVSKSAGI